MLKAGSSSTGMCLQTVMLARGLDPALEDSYPYVRIVEDLKDGSLQYMAADQLTQTHEWSFDVAALSPTGYRSALTKLQP